MFNSLLEDALLLWQAVGCHSAFNITAHQNLLRASSTFHLLYFIVMETYIDLGKQYFLLLNIIPMQSIIRFISCPACLCCGIKTAIRAEGEERILPPLLDVITSQKNIGAGDCIRLLCQKKKNIYLLKKTDKLS